VPFAAVAAIFASSSAVGCATAMVTVSPLVWLSQLHATPLSAFAAAAGLPLLGEKASSSPKLGLKSYMVCRETSASQATVTGVPEPAAALGDGDEASAEGDADVEARGLLDADADGFVSGVHPLRAVAARPATSRTGSTVYSGVRRSGVRRSGESMAPSSPTASMHAVGRARSSLMTADRISA